MEATNWESVTIGSLLDSGAIIGHKDGNHGSQYPRVEEFGSIGVPFLTAKSLSDGKIDIEGAPRLADEKANKLRLGFVRPGDVLLSHNATVGRVAIVPKFNGRVLIGTSLTYFRLNPSTISPRYLAAYFSGADFQNQLAAVMSQTTRNQVPITSQRKLRIVLPPVAEQEAIAHILGTLDDKIELNRRMNEALEAMAKALFKSWFIDFDPVRAKVDGRKPEGMDEATARLFPSSFGDSDLGSIPEGWRVEPVGSAVRAVGGGTPSTTVTEYWENGSYHWTTPKDLSALTSPILLNTERRLTDAGLAKVSSGLLPVGTVLMSSRAPVGYLAISQVPIAVNQGFIAMICDKIVSKFYVLNWCHANMDEIERRAGGTTFQEISKQNFRPIPMLIPEGSVIDRFTALVRPLYERITANMRESLTLATARDSLLPKLLSGELRIKHAERFVEASL
jgi:type I restriction enzyme, S subunit